MAKDSSISVLCLIPARAGSKGVPHKNTMIFQGKSLIERAVDCALGSSSVNKVVVNSDDQNILNEVDESIDQKRVIKQLRPEHLGQDNSSIVDVVLDAMNKIEDFFDIIILLQVTSPLRTSKDIDNIVKYFKNDDKLEGVISVVPVNDNHPARMYKINDYKLVALNHTNESKHRQQLDEVYLRNGCFYAIRTKALTTQKTFMPKIKKPYVMNSEHLLNIDSPRDVIIANDLIKAWENHNL
jgi:CMP-N-acetylneuraminic acid synthetase